MFLQKKELVNQVIRACQVLVFHAEITVSNALDLDRSHNHLTSAAWECQA